MVVQVCCQMSVWSPLDLWWPGIGFTTLLLRDGILFPVATVKAAVFLSVVNT